MLLYLNDQVGEVSGTVFLSYGRTQLPLPDFRAEPFTTQLRYVSLQHHTNIFSSEEFYSIATVVLCYWSIFRPEDYPIDYPLVENKCLSPAYCHRQVTYAERETWIGARAAAVEVANSWGGLPIIDYVQLSNEGDE